MASLAARRVRASLLVGASGYSLVELLVVLIVIGVLSIAMTSFLSAQLFEGLRHEKAAKETDDASRLQHLLDTEIGEASEIEYSPALPGSCGSGASLFSLKIPDGYVDLTALPNYYLIYYYQSSGAIYRCGKPALANGRLDFSSGDVSARLSSNLSLGVDTANSGSSLVRYSILSPQGRVVASADAYARAGIIR